MIKRTIGLLLILIFSDFLISSGRTSGKENLEKLKVIRVASVDTIRGKVEVEYAEPEEDLSDVFSEKLDTMVNSWYINNLFLSADMENGVDTMNIGLLQDSVYVSRLKKIEQVIGLPFNKVVSNLIGFYTTRRKEKVEVMLGLSAIYFPIFEEILDKYNLPLELKYLSIIESALNPRAISRAGATGMWQFMYGTAKSMKMEVNSLVDERRDIIRSTEKAAQYLKQLFDLYKDWNLAIAAYNCGPGNINKAIARSGNKTDYWSIYYRLPRETRGYVPAFIAASYVMNYFREHNLSPVYPQVPLSSDTIMINKRLNLIQVAENLNINLELLREINPIYKRDIIPATPEKPYPLRLPQDKITDFIKLQDTIYAHNREIYFPNKSIIEPNEPSGSGFAPVDIKGKDKVFYTIKSGDNLGFIASWFNVRSADLRYWNDLYRNLIRAGQKLVIYVNSGKGNYYSKFDDMTFDEKQAAIGAVSKLTAGPEPLLIDENYEYYTVKSGDNLWDIARKFPGVTNSDIMRLNNITNARGLYIGQKLKIRKKA
jgi:membrane-bound lytic murein transglycosylase D